MITINGSKIPGHLIFTDLVGSLLDHNTYSFEPAIDTLEMLEELGIPVIVCTSKTSSEIRRFQKDAGIRHPFISENGGAIFVPSGYFSNDIGSCRHDKGFDVIELGTPVSHLERVLDMIRHQGIGIKSFADMTMKELAEDTGLDKQSARLARKREYDQAFRIEDSKDTERIREMIEAEGFRFSKGGRYAHITGDNDKGRAVRILSDLYKKEYPAQDIKTIGLGDGDNDLPMLETVDIAVLIKNRAHKTPKVKDDVIRSKKEGPVGWSLEIRNILRQNS